MESKHMRIYPHEELANNESIGSSKLLYENQTSCRITLGDVQSEKRLSNGPEDGDYKYYGNHSRTNQLPYLEITQRTPRYIVYRDRRDRRSSLDSLNAPIRSSSDESEDEILYQASEYYRQLEKHSPNEGMYSTPLTLSPLSVKSSNSASTNKKGQLGQDGRESRSDHFANAFKSSATSSSHELHERPDKYQYSNKHPAKISATDMSVFSSSRGGNKSPTQISPDLRLHLEAEETNASPYLFYRLDGSPRRHENDKQFIYYYSNGIVRDPPLNGMIISRFQFYDFQGLNGSFNPTGYGVVGPVYYEPAREDDIYFPKEGKEKSSSVQACSSISSNSFTPRSTRTHSVFTGNEESKVRLHYGYIQPGAYNPNNQVTGDGQAGGSSLVNASASTAVSLSSKTVKDDDGPRVVGPTFVPTIKLNGEDVSDGRDSTFSEIRYNREKDIHEGTEAEPEETMPINKADRKEELGDQK